MPAMKRLGQLLDNNRRWADEVTRKDPQFFARLVAQQLGAEGQAPGKQLSPEHVQWVSALVKDLQQHRGASLVISGEWQPPIVHALADFLILDGCFFIGRLLRFNELTFKKRNIFRVVKLHNVSTGVNAARNKVRYH